jgi:hypothetical protein
MTDVVKMLRSAVVNIADEAADEIEQLRSALRPFAKMAIIFNEEHRSSNIPETGSWYSYGLMLDGKTVVLSLTVEDFQIARAALDGK